MIKDDPPRSDKLVVTPAEFERSRIRLEKMARLERLWRQSDLREAYEQGLEVGRKMAREGHVLPEVNPDDAIARIQRHQSRLKVAETPHEELSLLSLAELTRMSSKLFKEILSRMT